MALIQLKRFGWDSWTRTSEMQESKSCALPLGYIPTGNANIKFCGVDNRVRTDDTQSHNLVLYQLSYTHHTTHKNANGAPGEIRTPGPLLRRQLLYPTELRAHIPPWKIVERVMGIEPTQSAWKAEILAIELHPHSCLFFNRLSIISN